MGTEPLSEGVEVELMDLDAHGCCELDDDCSSSWTEESWDVEIDVPNTDREDN